MYLSVWLHIYIYTVYYINFFKFEKKKLFKCYILDDTLCQEGGEGQNPFNSSS